MTWRRVAQEPSRSRVLIVAGGVLSTAFVTAVSWASGTRSLWWFPAVMGTWLVLVLAIAVAVISGSVRAGIRAHARPTRFVRSRNTFGVAPVLSPGLTAMLQIMVSGFMVATVLLGPLRRIEHVDLALSTLHIVYNSVTTIMVVVIVLLTVAIVLYAWRGFAVELTRAGVRWRGPLFGRLVPWEALAPGGPPRPQLNAKRLHLAVVRPELVVQRGWTLGFGPPRRPAVPLQVDVHPWFLADAIRWYAEHPNDRDGIGTDAEHQRLIAELTTPQPDYQRTAAAAGQRPRRPMVVGIAAWLTRAGVALGLLAAAADLAVAIVFSDQLAAADRAIEAEAQRTSGEPVGVPIVTAADFAMGWAIGVLVLASVAGVLAILLVRETMRGNDAGRIGLVVLSSLVAAWAICPVGPPSLILTDTPDAPLLGAGVLTLWLLQRGVTLTLAAAVVVLLLLPTANQYFRPKVIERPGIDASTGSTLNKDTAAMRSADPTEPESAPPPATTGQAIQLVRPRHVGTAMALVYVAVAIALVTAAAELVITIVFRENLLAAERAIAESMPPLPPPDGQADPTLIFNTDTAAFARGWATAALIGTLLVALVAIVLARTMSRGSNRARVGLAVLSGVTALLAICPFVWLPIGLAAEPAAGTLLNVWPAVRMLEGSAVTGLAVAVLVLLLSAEVVAYSRRSP